MSNKLKMTYMLTTAAKAHVIFLTIYGDTIVCLLFLIPSFCLYNSSKTEKMSKY